MTCRTATLTLFLLLPACVPAVASETLYANGPVSGTANAWTVVLRQAYEQDRATTLIVFDYATGIASRIVLDGSSQKVLREQKLPGRPQSSQKEFQEAIEIIRQDHKLSHFISGGAVPEGGFIVDGPSGYPSQDRYIQIRLLSLDRRSLLRLVLVDLTLGVAASDSAWYE